MRSTKWATDRPPRLRWRDRICSRDKVHGVARVWSGHSSPLHLTNGATLQTRKDRSQGKSTPLNSDFQWAAS
eukprot:3139192-Pyramimonas_sp.AAC.1